jgi:hypothetical protein
MRKFLVSVGAAALLVVPAFTAGAFASPAHGTAESTTLDACGYFGGVQTAANTKTDGATTTQHGTWTGVINNSDQSPVASLGKVQGAFEETTTHNFDGLGDTSGTETFTSNAGQISQTFTYGPGVIGGFNVSVTATRDLAFLTSDTNGQCYMGPVPRP